MLSACLTSACGLTSPQRPDRRSLAQHKLLYFSTHYICIDAKPIRTRNRTQTMRVLVREHPRSLALVSGDHVLIFRHFFNTQSTDERPKCIVEFSKITDTLELDTTYRPLSAQECYGFLGIINVDGEVYLCTITRAAQVASPRQNETVYRIYNVEFHCLTRPDWDFVTLDANGYAIDVEQKAPSIEHPCTMLKKLLSNGSFYYSTDFDLTCTLQNR